MLHECSGFLGHIEAANQVDLNHLVEVLAWPWTIASQRASRRCDASTINGKRDAAHDFVGLLHDGLYRNFIGHISLLKCSAFTQRGCAGCALFVIDIEQYDLPSRVDDPLRGGKSESRCTARNDGLRNC